MDRNFMNHLYSDLFGDNPVEPAKDDPAAAAAGAGDVTPAQAGAGDITPTQAGAGGVTPTQAGAGDVTPVQAGAGDVTPAQAGADSVIPVQAGTDGMTPAQAGVDAPSDASSKNSFDALQDAITGKLASQEDALKHAQDALEEARKLFGGIDEIAGKTGSFLNDAIAGSAELIGSLPGIKLPEGYTPAGDGAVAESSGENSVQAAAEPAKEEPEEDPMEQLDKLIGLTTIKHDVRELADFVSVQKMRRDEGLKSVPVSLHLVFTGNPGTGKTTVARILAKLYKNIGILSKGQLVEVDRSGLVAGYVGQTAIKTQEKIAEAMGGVLFIDEAYSLAQKDDAFGQEAIDTILKAMEDHRDDFVVVVAGYTKPMEKFINSNPGLKSRFNKYIEFPDYTVDELEQIFEMNCRKYDYEVEEDARKHVREMIVAKKLAETENFANAREVRNMFEQIITNQARRVKQLEAPTHEDMVTITMEDLDLSDGKMSEAAEALAAEITAAVPLPETPEHVSEAAIEAALEKKAESDALTPEETGGAIDIPETPEEAK